MEEDGYYEEEGGSVEKVTESSIKLQLRNNNIVFLVVFQLPDFQHVAYNFYH
jgi:hypothetical protein